MSAVNKDELVEVLEDVSRAVPEPTWDFLVYCRFLSGRLPETEKVSPADLARLAEELIADLRVGVDRTTQGTFDPPLLNGRSDLLHDFFRAKLNLVAEKVGGDDFAAAFATASQAAVPGTGG
jgi:hypothetical protein